MFNEMMPMSLGGGGVTVYTETFTTTTDGEEKTINTGLTSIHTICIFSVGQNQYDTQSFLHWNESMGQNFYAGGAYGTNFGYSYKNESFTSSANNYSPVIDSITNGTVVIKCVGNGNWNPQEYTFYAW